MSKIELLNNIDHANFGVLAKYSKELGHDVSGCVVFPFEFVSAHREYPIVIQKNADTDEFESVILFGFEEGENLFLEEDGGWGAAYIPAVVQREPFMIGVRKDSEELVVNIDVDNPWVTRDGNGQSLFMENGGNSPYLEEVKEILLKIHEGVGSQRELMRSLDSMGLIENCTINVDFSNGKRFETDMFYTINQDRLSELDERAIYEMHQSGVLQLVYMMINSMGNMKGLMKRKELTLVNS